MFIFSFGLAFISHKQHGIFYYPSVVGIGIAEAKKKPVFNFNSNEYN